MLLNVFVDIWQAIYKVLYSSLVADNRYKLILRGLGNTMKIAVIACLIGLVIGLIMAVIKVVNASTGKIKILAAIANLYITIIRGTPVVVQLIILNGTLLMFPTLWVAVITFGINSGAYVAEIIRAGITSIDKGQTEAGRSLGLNYIQTMKEIVLPQAIKNILPAIGNEFIALVKETSVAGWVGVVDLTKASDNILSRTFNIGPMYVTAVIYLIIVIGISKLLSILERRLSRGDYR